MDYVALKAELDAGHPVTGAYSVDDATAVGECNALNIVRVRETMAGQEMFEATDPAEYATRTDSKKIEWVSFCGIPTHNPETNGPAHLFVEYIFGNPSTTRTNLISARNETVSQMTVLGIGEVNIGDVQNARALA